MKWFKHRTDTAAHFFYQTLLKKFQFSGYGKYWRLIEEMADRGRIISNKHLKYETNLSTLMFLLKFKRDKLKHFLRFLGSFPQFEITYERGDDKEINVTIIFFDFVGYTNLYPKRMPHKDKETPKQEPEEEVKQETGLKAGDKIYFNIRGERVEFEMETPTICKRNDKHFLLSHLVSMYGRYILEVEETEK